MNHEPQCSGKRDGRVWLNRNDIARRVGGAPQLGRRLRAATDRGVLGEIQFCRMPRTALLPRRVN